jgi:hypothetical protein
MIHYSHNIVHLLILRNNKPIGIFFYWAVVRVGNEKDLLYKK